MMPYVMWIGAYLVGSIPVGWLIARSRGVNILQRGSGNVGATNIGRVLGKPLGFLVFALDFLKGAFPTAAAGLVGDPEGWPASSVIVGAGFVALLGHVFPLFLGFRGGKGVATAAGVVSVIFPVPALAAFLGFLAVLTATRYVSLAALYAVGVLVAVYCLQRNTVNPTDPRLAFALVAALLIVVRHRGNIARLRDGTERSISPSPILEPTARSLHVLSLAIWCGAVIFFSFVTALALFGDFEALGQKPAERRPAWFPLVAEFEHQDPKVDDKIEFDGHKEQGTRAAGYAVGGIFPAYFSWQIMCGIVAFGTALGWPRFRPWLIGIALLLVAASFPVEHKVSDLRDPRNEAIEAYLKAPAAERDSLRPAARAAKSTFVRWHLLSLFLNMGVVGLVVIATAMAGNLPKQRES
jgi:glycerol-3-phosphate acyltransferase PlsY